jgi:arginine exporter protein ArgO
MAPNWPSKLACALGAAVGIFVWFLILSYGVSLGRHRLTPAKLLRMEHWSGILLLAFAAILGARLVVHLSQ